MFKRFFSTLGSAAFILLASLALPGEIFAMPLYSTCSAATTTTPDAFYQSLYNNLTARNTNFTLTYIGNMNDIFTGDIDQILAKAYEINAPSVSTDYDYLKYSIDSISVGYAQITNGCEFIFKMSYMETPEQLAAVSQETAAFSTSLSGLSDYEKAAKIHDFVVQQVTYDTTLTKFTAYDALIGQSAVCQGYTLLTYRLLTEAGIPCRYIEGTANNEHHSWNIAQIDGVWYAIDTTWDDITSDGQSICRDYFLIGSAKLYRDHTPDAYFESAEFKASFPMSQTDYRQS